MGVTVIPHDYAELMASELTNAGFTAQPTPTPEDLGSELPVVIVSAPGGTRLNMVIDNPLFSVDVYAATIAAAMDTAREAFAVVCRLPFSPALNQWRDCTVQSLPYENPDPRHPSLARVSFTANVAIRAKS